MPHVVTQSCVGDGSCVFACPVNCIQPTPDDPAFELAEMLHIDPATCVDCGACVAACPVDAIKPHARARRRRAGLPRDQRRLPPREPRKRRSWRPCAPRAARPRPRPEPLRVAIVGSGPAAMYAADELLTIPGARSTVLRAARPPVRSGAQRRRPGPPPHAPREPASSTASARHRRLHACTSASRSAATSPTTELLDQPPRRDLRGRCRLRPAPRHPGRRAARRRLGDGASSAGTTATPTSRTGRSTCPHRRAVVIGNGNVALDVARILDRRSRGARRHRHRARAPWRRCARSRVEEVVVVGRRGAGAVGVHAARAGRPDRDARRRARVDPAELARPRRRPEARPAALARPAAARGPPHPPALRLTPRADRRRRPRRSGRVRAPTATSGGRSAEAGLGAHRRSATAACPSRGLPFDARTGTVPNDDGRVATRRVRPAPTWPAGSSADRRASSARTSAAPRTPSPRSSTTTTPAGCRPSGPLSAPPGSTWRAAA